MQPLADYYQMSDAGVLHDSSQADAGKNASAPIRAALVADPTKYTICSNCFPKAAARQKAEAEPLPAKRTRASGKTEPRAEGHSRTAEDDQKDTAASDG